MSKKITAIDLANTILKMHHHDGWSIRVTQGGGSRCMQGLKEIWIDHRDQEDIFLSDEKRLKEVSDGKG